MHGDWKRAKQWLFLGVLFAAAGAEVVGNVMPHARRAQEAGLATRATRESLRGHFDGAGSERRGREGGPAPRAGRGSIPGGGSGPSEWHPGGGCGGGASVRIALPSGGQGEVSGRDDRGD